jgi:hypothetical protein
MSMTIVTMSLQIAVRPAVSGVVHVLGDESGVFQFAGVTARGVNSAVGPVLLIID